MDDVTAHPPPRKGAPEGYYPDPLGSGRARWWDGSAWTLRVGPRVDLDADPSQPAQPPKRLCRHCGVQSETFADDCPNCGRGYGSLSGGAIAAIVIGSIVAAVLLLGGCGLLIKAGIDAANDQAEKTAISRAQYDSVAIGDDEARVRASLGEPAREKTNGVTTCLFYGREGEGVFGEEDYRLCFVNGVLLSKSAT